MKKTFSFHIFLLIVSFLVLNFSIHAQISTSITTPSTSSGRHFIHVATTSNSTSNWTTIDNQYTNNNPEAKIFITHNYKGSGTGIYNNHASGLWYNGTKWTIFSEDITTIPENSSYNVLVADESNSTVFQHSADSSNTILNWTVLHHPDLDGNPDARIMVTQILIDTSGDVYNNSEIGVWYDGSHWAVFNQDLSNMPIGASFNILILDEKNSILHVAVSGSIVGSTTKIDNPALNDNPNAIIYVTQNWNPGGFGGVYNNMNVSTYYNGHNWTIYREDNTTMVVNSSYNVYIGSESFVHLSAANNISSDLSRIDHPLLNGDSDAHIFVLHNWNPFGSGTSIYDKKLGLYYDGNYWGIYNEDQENFVSNNYFNTFIAPKTDSAFVHLTTAANISSNYTTIDNPLLNGNPTAKIIVQHVYASSRHNVNVGVWYNPSTAKWTIFNEDHSAMPEGKAFNVLLLNNDKSFIHTVNAENNIGDSAYSYIDNPLTNDNPDANILVTAILQSSPYLDHVQGVWYDASAKKWVLYNEDLKSYTLGVKFVVYVSNSIGVVTDVKQETNPVTVSNFDLQQNYPNPFNPSTKIRYSIADQSLVTLKVYNVLGKEIATLVDEVKGEGTYEVNFNGSGLASGVYFYTLQAGKITQTRKMILMK